ncbi:hypothetical protein [Mycolicibacterium aromaticivorans]|nr:hypothetical protein [Mycolicibacterium aromaticivorans]
MSDAERATAIAAAVTSAVITLMIATDAQLALLETLLRALTVMDDDVLLDDFIRRVSDLRALVGPACTEATMKIARRR